ncbi:LytTR family transcriptional regulator DNA-binding domain-containing protein [Lutibacter sp. Hel_I_33_5]|uniref:LytTR family transcriptional regulator DNA-binding domain-containing protein n=1 Tax=Lutibacter sp. Hel_I_33_5 TaxID=1566289 RepID=UPI001645CD51|nr:LytTR family transcriptional regulator DNA-binding domain-containing protein [Lutibacter sp. Hel_I_33_5]
MLFATIIISIIIFYGSIFLNINTPSITLFDLLKFGVLGSIIPNFIFFISDEYFKIKLDKNEKSHKKEKITIYSLNKKESFSFLTNSLVYINSQGNYVSFFLLKNNELKEKVIRNTISEIEKELKGEENIIRVHRSYIVNKDFILDYKGNSKGYKLILKKFPQLIPVSRSFSKKKLQNKILY